MEKAVFTGFDQSTIHFIAGLSANNSKLWFDEHRSDYENHYLEPAKDFVAALVEPLGRLSPDLNAEPRVNGSIFRINRDIRFSRDKTPYKDHLDLWFWHGERKGAVSGLFFRLTGVSLILGAGAYGFDKARLSRYRKAVVDPVAGAQLLDIERQLGKDGFELQGAHYARTPRGFAPDNADCERLLKFNALTASRTRIHPPQLNSPDFVEWCCEQWRPLIPLHNWLVAMDEGA